MAGIVIKTCARFKPGWAKSKGFAVELHVAVGRPRARPRNAGLAHRKAEHTAISFRVPDIVASIAELQKAGVLFEDYDLPGFKTVDHVCVLGSEKAAWFKDTEGNYLCIHEDLA